VTSPLQIYAAYQQRLQNQDYAHLGEVVDFQGYTENCLGLTGWTTGFEVALQNWAKNILAAFSDLQFETKDAFEGPDRLAIRSRAEGTHSGTFLGVPSTGRRIAWDVVFLVHTNDGRMVGQWIQSDLWGIYQQLTSAEPKAPTTVAPDPPREWAQSAH
jgi:predicted ester cyclase